MRRASWRSASARATCHIRVRSGSTRRATPASSARSGELVVFVDDDVEASDGWLDGAARRRPRTSAGGRLHRTDPRPPRGPRAAHAAGARRPPITTLDLGLADTDAPLRVGREHGDPPQRARARGAVRRLARARRRRAGVAGTPARADARRARSSTSRRPRSSTAARGARRAPARARARGAYARGRAARRFDARRGAAPSLRARAADARRLRRPRRAAPLPGRPDDGRPQRRAPARGACERAPGARAPRQRGRAMPTPRTSSRATSGTVGGLDALRRGADRSRRRRVASSRAVGACAWRSPRAVRHRRGAVLVLGVERPEHARARARDRAPSSLRSRHDVELHTARPGRAWQVREPQPAARGRIQPTAATGCW